MEQRGDVLRQALAKNAFETGNWKEFKEDNEAAIANLEMFSKKLTVEVLVPIGTKALMPGELIHTNELLVGHYRGYFSSCSAHKAKEICEHRLKLAEKYLKELQVEADLWHNKLEKPVVEGVVPKSDEIEIVEEFNEEAHNKWLRKHKERLHKEKQEEREQREASVKNDSDALEKLAVHELMEELGVDPNNIDEETLNDMLNKETESEPDPPESEVSDEETPTAMSDEQLFEILDKLEAQERQEIVQIDTETEQNLQGTQEMVLNLMQEQKEVKGGKQRIGRVNNNAEKTNEVVETGQEDAVDDEVDEDEDTNLPDEVKYIRYQMSLLSKADRREFLKTQLGIIKAKMRRIQKKCFISDELTHLMNVTVNLEDDLNEMIFEQLEDGSSEEQSEDTDSVSKNRRISFAKTDEQLLFRKHETVAEMLPKGKQQRDVISLDAILQPAKQEVTYEEPANATCPQIMQKVEKSLQFVNENQSIQDFDLVNQILEASTGRINTLQISFYHSEATAPTEEFDKNSIPGNPSHFYQLYKMALDETKSSNSFPIYVNSFEGEEELKVPILKEEEREAAYEDPRVHFSKMCETQENTGTSTDAIRPETKSILRNKSSVESETRAVIEESKPQPATKKSKKKRNKKKKQRTIDDDLLDMSAYQKVMQDLVERELIAPEPTAQEPTAPAEPTVPEPLPEGKYVDAHAPKKRISRFKEQRSMNKT